METYEALSMEDDHSLRKIIQNFVDQKDVVETLNKKIQHLEAIKNKTQDDKDRIASNKTVLARDLRDLKMWEHEAGIAHEILVQRKREQSKGKFKRSRHAYVMLLKRYTETLTSDEMRSAISELNATDNKDTMRKIFTHYQTLVLNREPSTQALTAEEVERIQANPLEELAPTIQAFARAKLSEKIRGNNIVMQKPPKSISQAKTTQTQTVVPYNAFKFTEKGNQRFMEPITPEKAEELQMKKKTIQSVVLLDPNRYKRRPYIVRSR